MSMTTLSNSQSDGKHTIHLASEILLGIMAFVKRQRKYQATLYACCLVSRLWYSAAIALLYQSPIIYDTWMERNSTEFVRTMFQPTTMFGRQIPLAGYIRKLDLGNSKLAACSQEERTRVAEDLVEMTAGNLEELSPAPGVDYSARMFRILSKCQNLTRLDLSHLSGPFLVSDLLDTVSELSHLKAFHFPRYVSWSPRRPSVGDENTLSQESKKIHKWLDSLESFHIPCSLYRAFLDAVLLAPPSLSRLTIEMGAGNFKENVMHSIRQHLGTQILSITGKDRSSLTVDKALRLLIWGFPNLLHLGVNQDFILARAFDAIKRDPSHPTYPLRSLNIYPGAKGYYSHSLIRELYKGLESGWFQDLLTVRFTEPILRHLSDG